MKRANDTRKKTRIALIGAGGWGRQHARVLSEHPDVEFCALMCRTRERAETRAAEYGVTAYTDFDAMLEREQPDMVSLCLPNQGHFDATLRVIQAGVHLLVEKPLVFDLKEADILIEEARKRNLFFAINFNHRYAVPMRRAKDAIASGRLGPLVFATWRFGGEGGGGHAHANLIETQCHAFDSLEFLCGPIRSVSAQMTDLTGKGFSTLALALRFDNGAVGTLLGSYDSSYAYENTQRLEVNGTRGRVVIEDTVRRYTFQTAGSEMAEVWQAGYFNDRDREFHRTFDRHFEAILQSFRAGEAPPVPAEAGRRALQLSDAAIRSWETGARVDVAEENGIERVTR